MKLNKASFQYMFAMLFSVATLFAQNITGTVNGDEGNALAGAPWSFAWVFTMPGTYDYQCDPHVGMGMIGVIIVNTMNDIQVK